VAAIPSIIFLAGLLIIPESPRWLISKGELARGKEILVRIFGADAAEQHVKAVQQAATAEEGSWRELFAPGIRKRLSVGIMLAIFCQITGINTVLYFGSIIVTEHFLGQSTSVALAANVIIGLVNLVFTIMALIYLDRWGRRAILMIASGGMGVALTVLVVALKLQGAAAVFILGSIAVYVAFFALGMGPGPWLVISEIFPTKVRGRAASIATSALWSSTLLVTFTFLILVKKLGLAATFAIYGALSFICLFYVWKMVPETKGKTLEQIQESWDR